MWKLKASRCIYRSETNTTVHENWLFRWLMFDSDGIQTLMYKRNPARFGLHYIKALILTAQLLPGTTCLLGLGGGGVLHALKPTALSPVTVVELLPEVINLATQYFMLDTLSHVETIQGDALDFIRDTSTCYDHILIDLFNAHHFPQACLNLNFFKVCQSKLQANGVLAVNLANPSDHIPVFTWLKQLFNGSVIVIPIKYSSNLVLLASNRKPAEFVQLVQQAQVLKKIIWDQRWGYITGF